MSEYWVSHKKYYCTYCKIYISDDAPSKQQHENGLRHKGNKERFVRSLYKTSEKRKHDLEEEKREIARIDQAAQAAFAHDVGTGITKSTTNARPIASTSNSVAKAVVAPKPSSPWANYSTAESLGYTDPDAERMQAETERRRTQGVVGEWEVISTPTSQDPGPSTILAENRKREAEVQAVDFEDARHFKLRKKTAKGLGDIWDPGLIPIKLKPKKEEETVVDSEGFKVEESVEPIAALPKWTSRGWKRPGESEAPDADNNEATFVPEPQPEQQKLSPERENETESLPNLKDENSIPVVTEDFAVKTETIIIQPTSSEGGGSLFRKRKIGSSNRGKR